MIKKYCRYMFWLMLLMMIASITGCVSTVPYINSNGPNPVKLKPSEVHLFKYVFVDQEGEELVVYGKVEHNHQSCNHEGHVDLAILSPAGEVRLKNSMVLKQGSTKVTGWHGAAFRTRLHFSLKPGDVVVMSFHGEECLAGETFDCGENAAAVM